MACNSCSKSFSLLRKEKGCPSCGFSYCSNCLKYKQFVPKLNAEAKVCPKCERANKTNEKTTIEPPDAYYKRIGAMDEQPKSNNSSNVANIKPGPSSSSSVDQEILNRLQKLKEDTQKIVPATTEDIANRLQKIKGDLPSTSDEELQSRLANLRGVPVSTLRSNPVPILPDNRTEQEQVEDLLKQCMDHAKIDSQYQEEFQGVIDDIQARLQKLKSAAGTTSVGQTEDTDKNVDSENYEDILKKIIEKAKAESTLEIEDVNPELEELPFCEICNEDAKMRCLGCKYLFCKRCFIEHKDEDDGCDKYEPYKPPKTFTS